MRLLRSNQGLCNDPERREGALYTFLYEKRRAAQFCKRSTERAGQQGGQVDQSMIFACHVFLRRVSVRACVKHPGRIGCSLIDNL